MPRGYGRGWFGPRFISGFGRGFWGWHGNPYSYCRWYPWLPRWWWTGLYGPMSAYTMPKEQEITLLQDEVKMLEQTLVDVRKRLEELQKKED